MRRGKSGTATSKSLKLSIAPSDLLCSNHIAKMGERPSDFSLNALKLSEKKQMDYSVVMHWLREKLSFSLLRSAVLCVRGSKQTNTILVGQKPKT